MHIMAVALPTPEKGIKKPSIEMDGIVYKKLITPSAGLAAFGNSLIRIPTSPPNSMAIKIETNAISKCSSNNSQKRYVVYFYG